jgi:hypothetical protein
MIVLTAVTALRPVRVGLRPSKGGSAGQEAFQPVPWHGASAVRFGQSEGRTRQPDGQKTRDGRLYHILNVHAYNEDRDIAIFQLGRKMSLGTELAKDLPHL